MMNKGIFSLLGGAVAVGMMLMDYRKLAQLGWLFYGIGILILVMLQTSSSFISWRFCYSSRTILDWELDSYHMFLLLAWACFFNHKKLKLWQFS